MSHAKQLHHRRYLNDYLEIFNWKGQTGKATTDLYPQVQDPVTATVQYILETVLDEELSAYLELALYTHLPWVAHRR
jgi:hypothetical protein